MRVNLYLTRQTAGPQESQLSCLFCFNSHGVEWETSFRPEGTGKLITAGVCEGCRARLERVHGEILADLALAFAEFEHELLLCPATTVHGMEESTSVCSNCGTSSEDFHTIRDCFARYKQAEDNAHNQVCDYLSARIAYLEKELHVFWDGDSIWVVAHDSDDAALVYAEHIGDVDSFDALQFTRVPDEQQIAIRVWVSGPDKGEIASADEEDGTDAIAPRMESARFWARLEGRGFLCTTDY
jgi:hypothetical protein